MTEVEVLSTNYDGGSGCLVITNDKKVYLLNFKTQGFRNPKVGEKVMILLPELKILGYKSEPKMIEAHEYEITNYNDFGYHVRISAYESSTHTTISKHLIQLLGREPKYGDRIWCIWVGTNLVPIGYSL